MPLSIIRQPNRWSCGLASFAMIFDLSIKKAIRLIGHDGSQIIWPDAPEPEKRRGFPMNDLIDAAWKLESALVQFDACPMISSLNVETKPYPLYAEHELDTRMTRILSQGRGLILGRYAMDKWHMVAWDSEDGLVYDPQEPRFYSFGDRSEHITIEQVWIRKDFR